MERIDRPTVASFHSPEPIVAPVGASVALGEDAAHHARVKRIEVGARVQLVDGAGTIAQGTLVRLAKQQLLVELEELAHHDRLPPAHLMVPIADRVTVFEGDAAALLPLVAPVDVVLANLLSSVLVELLPAIARSLAPDGRAILSGILGEERDDMLALLDGGGWTILEEDAEDIWWSASIARR